MYTSDQLKQFNKHAHDYFNFGKGVVITMDRLLKTGPVTEELQDMYINKLQKGTVVFLEAVKHLQHKGEENESRS